MRYFSVLSAAVLLTLLAPTVALAQNVVPARTAETLLEACTSEDKAFLMRCTAYIGGVADGMDFIAAFQKVHGSALRGVKLTLKPFTICHDEPWTGDAVRQIFIDWANANPERLKDDQYGTVVDALHEALRCK